MRSYGEEEEEEERSIKKNSLKKALDCKKKSCGLVAKWEVGGIFYILAQHVLGQIMKRHFHFCHSLLM